MTLRIGRTRYDNPDASRLIAEVQQEYVVRYGGPDDTPVDPGEFAPPRGLFLVGYDDDGPVACGGWRSHDTDAEIKRMYVTTRARRLGYARLILAELERTAAAAGHTRIILETGGMQPEAIALYESAGYTPVEPFGHYADAPLSIHLGKSLKPSPSPPSSRPVEQSPPLGRRPVRRAAERPVERPRLRRAGRVIVLDPADRVLLFRYDNPPPNGPHWATPGGGLDDGETFVEAARRELAEETGWTDVTVGEEVVADRTFTMDYLGELVRQQERLFVGRVDAPARELGRVGAMHAQDGIAAWRWWTLAELDDTDDVVWPEGLADLIRSRLTS